MTERLVVIPVGDERYAVAAATVREVLAVPRPTPLPGAPAWVLGAVNLRGDAVPLLDTAGLLGLGNTSGSAVFAVVVRTSAGPAALTATGMPGVLDPEEQLGRPELAGGLARFRVAGELLVQIDPDALLAAARGELVDGAAPRR